ncbi:MAG TPA: hypothetical protein VKT78_11140, partial [Fimbriimonadaceae bacterium]|nr:hypothetical protein [Fimbriimonadaceae bacterium]
MYGRPFRLALVLAALAGVLPPARAIMPRTYTDVELANWPIIVVGYWPKAEVKPHTKGTNNSWEKWEFHTRLVVTRVIRGRLGVGNHHLLFDFGIGWNKEGKDVSSASSTSIPGDVDDVSKPCIWFLEWARSWDSADPAWYLHVRQFQCVQETRLARYFEILRHADRNTAITECLASADPKVAERAVRYVVGPGPLWPETAIDGGAPGIRHVSSNVPEHSLPRYIPFLRRIARSNKARTPEVAAAALAAVAGRAALPDLRRLAQAKNLAVAAVATAYLIHYHDWDDVKLIRSGIYRAYASPRAPANGFDEVGY